MSRRIPARPVITGRAGAPRDAGLAMFDAFGTRQRSSHANPAGHGDVPEHELAGAVTFLAG